MMSLVKCVITAVLSSSAGVARGGSGYACVLSDSNEVGQALYSCCGRLVQHIVDKAQSFKVSTDLPSSKGELSKEVHIVCVYVCLHACAYSVLKPNAVYVRPDDIRPA